MTYHEGGERPWAKDMPGYSRQSRISQAEQAHIPNDIFGASRQYDFEAFDGDVQVAQGLINTLAEEPKSGKVEDPEYPNCNCQCPDCKSNDHCGLSKCWNG